MPQLTVDEFRDECTAFLSANAKLRSNERRTFTWGEGDDDVAVLEEVDRDQELRDVERAKEWRALRFDAGLGWISGPPELGGRGLSRAHERLYERLESAYDVPSQSCFAIGLGMVAPTIRAHGQPQVQARYLPGMYRGDVIAAQLFSEPGAGSDLAGVQTRAERDGDEWVLNGQKVWTSGAHYSDIGEILCRTDVDQPKHKGLSAFVLDMRAPGVEIRPLRQMTGGAAFNEVFLSDVRVPDDHRLGDVGEGWTVALTTLMNERTTIGSGAGAGGGVGPANIKRLAQMLRHFGLGDSPVHRDELMAIHIRFQVAKLTNQRALARMKAGQLPGPEMSLGKLAMTNNLTAVGNFVGRVLGPRLVADSGEWGTYAWAQFVLGVPGLHLAGGTDEVLRNIVAERVLGLPKEPSDDAKVPFRSLPKN